MRISDLSSDVCSSDLSPVRLAFLPVSDAGFGAQVLPFDGGAACGAGRARTGQSFAIAMDVFDRALGTGRLAPGLTPSTQREQHRMKGLAFRGRAILMAGRTLAVEAPLDHAVRLEPFQPYREDLRRCAGMRLDQIGRAHV